MSRLDTAAVLLEQTKALARETGEAVAVLKRLRSELVIRAHYVPASDLIVKEYTFYEHWNKFGKTVLRSRREAEALQLIADEIELQDAPCRGAATDRGRNRTARRAMPVSAEGRARADALGWS